MGFIDDAWKDTVGKAGKTVAKGLGIVTDTTGAWGINRTGRNIQTGFVLPPRIPTFRAPKLGDPLAAGMTAKQAAKDKALLAYGLGGTVLTKPKGLGSAPSENLLYPKYLGA